MIDDIRSEGEKSWVTKFLRGSGPAAEVEDDEETVEIEPQYMDLLREKKESFIEKPDTRKRVYSPPEDLESAILEITLKVCPELTPENWLSQDLRDPSIKYQILTECFERFNHDVPNFLLDKMSTMKEVVDFYTQPVKDTTKFDELSTKDLPPNLKIHWEYQDDSQLELYQEYLDYTRVKKTGPPSKYPFKDTLF